MDGSCAGGGRAGAVAGAAGAAEGRMRRTARSCSVAAGAWPRACTAAVRARIRTVGVGAGADDGRATRKAAPRSP